ncbi:MAG: hypothetical protein KBA61_10070 [Spirochaetes bacterium]|nr:hypothetical protein [Spirochaetota bacterium]
MGGKLRKKRGDYFAESIAKLIEKDLQSGDFGCTLGALSHSEECAGLFLGVYNEGAIRKLFADIGLVAHLEKKGFRDTLIDVTRDDDGVSRLCVYHGRKDPRRLLIDMKVSETMFTPFKKYCVQDHRTPCTFHLVMIEWLESSHPGEKFTRVHPQLPGQRNPGLGVLKYMRDFLGAMARDIAHDGFMNIPDHVHTALMYADSFMFVNPRQEGFIRALLRDLKDARLDDITWGFATGTVVDAAGAPHVYQPSEQVYPVKEKLARHFRERHYLEERDAAIGELKFFFNRGEMLARRKKLLVGGDVAGM